MTSPDNSRTSRFLFLGLIVASLGVLNPRAAHAQIWEKTASLTTPIPAGGAVEALLDTLVHTLEQREGATVQRRSDSPDRMSVSALRNTLVDTHGIGIVTANTLFIDYRFTVGASGRLERDVTGLHFFFRQGPLQEDIPLLYVDAQEKWVRSLLHKEGTSLPTNEAAIIPFRRHLGFVTLARLPDVDVVDIDGETVHDGFSVKKEALIREIVHLVYGFE